MGLHGDVGRKQWVCFDWWNVVIFLRICIGEGDIEDWGRFDWSTNRGMEKNLIGRKRRDGL